MIEKNKRIIALLIAVIIIIGIQAVWMAIKLRQVTRENQKLNFLLYNPAGIMPETHKATLLPAIMITDIQTGKQTGMYEGVENKNLLIFAFSTDCYSCDQSAEIWNNVYETYNNRFIIRGVSRDDIPSIERYMARKNIKFPVYRYDAEPGFDVFSSFPQTVLTGKDGGIILSLNGIPTNLQTKLSGFGPN
jgi:hypothetical protein